MIPRITLKLTNSSEPVRLRVGAIDAVWNVVLGTYRSHTCVQVGSVTHEVAEDRDTVESMMQKAELSAGPVWP